MAKHGYISDSKSTKLFVAGVPSGVHPSAVLNFFRQFGRFELCPSMLSGPDACKGKGYCNLLSFDATETCRVVDQRFFSFMERTLTVTRHRSGIGLIVHNKKINKCRVIFKLVPCNYTESRFGNELTILCGEVESLFQFKPVVPSEQKLKIRNLPTRSIVFSVVFKSKEVAQALVKQGTLTLMDGTEIKTEAFLKGKKEKSTATQHPNETFKEQPRKETHKRLQKNSTLETEDSKNPTSQRKTMSQNATFSYQTKPSSSAYEAERRVQQTRGSEFNIDYERANYRFNIHSSEGFGQKICLVTTYGSILIRKH